MPDKTSAACFECGALVIRTATRDFLRDGRPVEIEGKVFDLIALLIEHRERALGKQEIVDVLWGPRPITDAALSQLIYKARRACGDDGERQAFIRTIYGRGLQWVAPTQEAAPEATAPGTAWPAAPTALCVHPTIPERPARGPRHAWLAAAALAIVILAVGMAWRLVPRGVAADATALPRIALLPIENATGDAALDWTTRGLPGLMASVLDQSRTLEVVDPLAVAHAWGYAPAQGEDRAAHTRAVTNATVLVGGTLRKLADLYELTLQVDPGGGRRGSAITLTGTEPGALAVAAIPRVRSTLNLQTMVPSAHGPSPSDAYLAQTFARGMDAAMHGRWADARPFFMLVANGDEDFLPGRYRLGQAQLRTGRADAAGPTLQAVLAAAERSDDPELAALALKELAYRAKLRHAFADTVTLLNQAAPFAERARNPEIQADLAIHAAEAQAGLKHHDDATRELEKVRALIDRHHLQQIRPSLHAAEIFIADSRGDYPALEDAARASLASRRALGDERGSTVAVYNIAYAMENLDRRVEALPLWAQVWKWGHDQQDYDLESGAAWYLASGLFNTGLGDLAGKINAFVLAAARKQNDRRQQALALQMRCGIEWMRGDTQAALRSAREASALIDGHNDPSSKLNAWSPEAFVALTTEPAAIASIAQRADVLIAAQPDPSAHRFRQQLLHALRAAAVNDADGARAALESARTLATSHSDTEELRQYAMNVALAVNDPQSAALALRDVDLEHATDAVFLHLAARWASMSGDAALAQRVARHQSGLRQAATDALRTTGVDASLALIDDSRP